MGQRVVRNLDEFTAGLARFGRNAARLQRAEMRKTEQRATRALKNASRSITGGDMVLGGVGRSGARLDVEVVRDTSSGRDIIASTVRSRGPWQLRDNSIRGGRTAPHDVGISVQKGQLRPLGPAKLFKPAVKLRRDGNFLSNNVRERGGPFISIAHRGSERRPAWRGAVRSIQPRIIEAHARAFNEALYETYG